MLTALDEGFSMAYDGMGGVASFELAGQSVRLKIEFSDAHALYKIFELCYKRGVTAGVAYVGQHVRALERGAQE